MYGIPKDMRLKEETKASSFYTFWTKKQNLGRICKTKRFGLGVAK